MNYKGFDKDLKCRNFQYEIGKEYEEKKAKTCETGFHACEYPLDVFRYYPPATSRFCEVEQSGNIDKDSNDAKIASTKIKIGAEIGIVDIVKASIEYIKSKVNWDNAKETNADDHGAATDTCNQSTATNTGNYSAATNMGSYSAATSTGDYSVATNTGYRSAATNTGYYSAATNTGNQSTAINSGYRSVATNTGYQSAATNTGNYSAATNTGCHSTATNAGNQSIAISTGDYSVATNTGNYSAAAAEGKDSMAMVTGAGSRARGAIGCWLVLTEREEGDGKTCPILDMKVVRVDGKKIEANTFYKLESGMVVKVK